MRCTVWSIIAILTYIIGMEQSETFTINVLIFLHKSKHSTWQVSTFVKIFFFLGEVGSVRVSCFIFAAPNVEKFGDQLDKFYECIGGRYL